KSLTVLAWFLAVEWTRLSTAAAIPNDVSNLMGEQTANMFVAGVVHPPNIESHRPASLLGHIVPLAEIHHANARLQIARQDSQILFRNGGEDFGDKPGDMRWAINRTRTNEVVRVIITAVSGLAEERDRDSLNALD